MKQNYCFDNCFSETLWFQLLQSEDLLFFPLFDIIIWISCFGPYTPPHLSLCSPPWWGRGLGLEQPCPVGRPECPEPPVSPSPGAPRAAPGLQPPGPLPSSAPGAQGQIKKYLKQMSFYCSFYADWPFLMMHIFQSSPADGATYLQLAATNTHIDRF